MAYISPWVFVRTIALLHVHLTCLGNSYDYPRLVTLFYISSGLARRIDEVSW